jgi:peptide/nickel transport system substrate-binding protein
MASGRFRKLLALFAALAIIASACGGSDGGTDAAPADSSSDEATTGSGGEEETTEDIGADESADGSEIETAEDVDEIVAGGTLRFGMQTEAGSLNPTNTGLNRGPIMVATAIFDTLVVVDAEGQWHNNLTESWTPNDDFSSWDVKLREGIEFSDGLPYDADAVIKTIEAFLADPLTSLVFKPAFAAENAVEKVDDLTFRINANGPNAVLPVYFAEQLGMVGSPAWLDAAAENPELDQTPIGAGPFVLEERSQDSSTVLVRNENWWRDDVEVFLDAVEFFPVPQPGTRADQLIVGDLDVVHGTAALMILPLRDAGEDILRVEDNSGEEFFFAMNATTAPFDDIRVRKAATHLFPKQDYEEFVNQGASLLADSLFSSESPWHDPSIQQEHDMPELAAPLIAEYCTEVPDACTDGKVNIEYQYDTNLSNDQIFDLVSDAMSEQFNITVQSIPNDVHIQEVIFGQYQFASWRYHGFSDPDVDTAFLTCSTIGALSINWSRNCNEERDALIVAQRQTQDFDERYAIWQDLQANLRDSYQYVLATHSNWTLGAGANVGGLCDSVTPEGVALPCQTRGVPRLDQVFLQN